MKIAIHGIPNLVEFERLYLKLNQDGCESGLENEEHYQQKYKIQDGWAFVDNNGGFFLWTIHKETPKAFFKRNNYLTLEYKDLDKYPEIML